MNLTLVGPVEDNLLAEVAKLARPSHYDRLDARVCRLKNVDDSPNIRRIVSSLCDFANVDHAYLKHGQTFGDFRLLAIDMDSTLISVESIDEIAAFAGKRAQVSEITESAMRGEIENFSQSLRARVALLAGLDANVLKRVYDERVSLSPGAATLIKQAQASKSYCMLVSGGFTYFTERLSLLLGFDAAYSNEIEVRDNRLTGRIIGPIVDAQHKARRVAEAVEELKILREQVIVIGDGSNDILMMSEAGTSVAYHAKPIVRGIATLQINFGGLDTLLDYFHK